MTNPTEPTGFRIWPVRVVIFMRTWEPFAVEFILLTLTTFLSFAMLRDGLTLATGRPIYEALEQLRATPDVWGALAAVSGFMMAAGLFVCLTDHGSQGGTILRMAGLGLSAFLWIVLGLTIWMVNPYAISWLPMVCHGITAAWAMLRYPAMPIRGA